MSPTSVANLTGGYREWAPPPRLSGSLTCLWGSAAGTDGDSTTVVLPDGCADLIWQQDRGGFVAGPDTGPNPALLPPGTVLLGARFRPGAGGSALGIPLAGLLNQRVDLADLRPDLASRLPAGIGPAEALSQLIEVCSGMLAAGPPDALVLHGTRMLHDPKARVSDLARALGVSDRQLLRRFDAAVGYGPKTLQRVLRFRRFLARMSAAETDVDLALLAFEAGYADQSHLTREAAALSGLTPRGLVAVAQRTW